MTDSIRIRAGLDLPISGTPDRRIEQGQRPRTVGLLSADFPGLKPTMLVQEGDRVQRGQPLFEDKQRPGVLHTSPAAGVVQTILRGAKRSFQSVVVAVEGDGTVTFDVPRNQDVGQLPREQVQQLLLSSGLWTALRTRPFSKVPTPGSIPAAIFVQAMDTSPLAGDPLLVIHEHSPDFVKGLQALQRLTGGAVHVCHAPGANVPGREVAGVQLHEFAGPHPAGLPGTHIHFISPVGPRKTVWTIGAQDVVAIGKLFATRELWSERVVSLAGPQVTSPRMLRTTLGTSLVDLTEGQLQPGENRIVSGSVLSGRALDGVHCYLGRYHTQVSVLREGREREFLGWQKPGLDKFSVKRVFASALAADGRRFPLTTSRNGSHRAIVPIGAYEQVMPLDILPTMLLRALLSGDADLAQNLGALELDEEDLALCTFVDPGKHEFGPILRQTLQRIEQEG